MKPFQLRIDSSVTKIILFALLLFIAWHIWIFASSKVTISAPFLAMPAAGYNWKDKKTADSRFFARNLDVVWEAGTKHPEFNAQTTEREGIWIPMPGYEFIDEPNSLSTKWTPGVLHPDFQAWADTGEGLWIPATGYKFVYEGDEFVATVWDPGQRYEDLKIISLQEQDSFIPFPGYRFVNPGKTFEVVWTPGLLNPDNPKLVSGSKEGSWEVNSRPSYRRDPTWLEKELVRAAIYRVL